MKTLTSIILLVVSFIRTDVTYLGEPLWFLWGNPDHISYVAEEHVWINDNPSRENIFREMDRYDGERRYTLPERVPEKRKVEIVFDPELFLRPENPLHQLQAMITYAATVPNRRLVLVNPEPTFNPDVCDEVQYQVWPHLGMLYVGTSAHNEGWEVVMHDELVQGPVDLERLIKPGDIVGLSLVATGMEHGVELAQHAKILGARYVVAGNDSAIFRVNQVLGLPERPIDAVFTGNSLIAVQEFLRSIIDVPMDQIDVSGVAVVPGGVDRSNERDVLVAERDMRISLQRQDRFDPQDVFVVPNLDLFEDEYWETVWSNYRTVFGHKHINPSKVKNALALFAQGCTRTGMTDVCSYCTIAGVADIRMPSREYLQSVLETYESFGIDYVFNTTDSAFEMRRVVRDLKDLGAFFPEGLMIYGRAWGLAHHPELIDDWLSLTEGRLLVNVGMDSGDARILDRGVVKASQSGSRIDENRQAVHNIAQSGAHLHYSLIFGSPGETRETCEKSLEFFEWSRNILREQLDQCETDIYWLNHGSPASRVFHDYDYAQELAALAGKEISRETWKQRFHQHRDTLSVPWECEEAWYECFTSIKIEEAQDLVSHVAKAMSEHVGAAPSRGNAFKPG